MFARMIVINQCFFTIEHWILHKQTTNKNLFMFEFVSYSTQNIFYRDSKFIFSLEEWTSRDFINNVINNFLSRWHLKKFIKNHKNKITFNDCLEYFWKMKIQECHLAKQSFVCMIKSIIVRFVLLSLWSAMFDRLTLKELTFY